MSNNTQNEQGLIFLRERLEQAIYDEDLSLIRKIVDEGVDLSTACLGDDQTPLALASELGCLEIISFFISVGVDVDQRMGSDGLTALFHAIYADEENARMTIEVVQSLVDAGATVDIQDFHGNTPLDVASSVQDETLRQDILKVLECSSLR